MEDKKNTQNLSVEEIKQKGNDCVKEENFVEAVLHYTQAIKLDPNNYVLHSNRSYAFLKMDQHFLSLQDANETIRLQPQWAKGYFRRAEVEAASGLFDEAIISYTRALQLEPHNTKIVESIKNLTFDQEKKIRDRQNVVWLCTCVGLILGIVVVVLDNCLAASPTLSHHFSMVAFAIALACIGWGIGYSAALMASWNDGQSLTPPEDLAAFSAERAAMTTSVPEPKKKYSKAQARHRYKQGKH